MALTLEKLTTPLTVDEVKTSIYQVLAAVGTNTTGWKPGAVVRTIIAAVAILVASLSELMALIAKSGFLELAEGDWLTLVAKYVFGVERVEATFAAGQVTLSNASGGVYVFDPGDLVVINPTKKKTYTNTTAFTLGALETGRVIDIRAVEVGADSTSPPGTITEIETPLIGVTVTNALAVVGLDAESDPTVRLRCNEKLSSLSPNGPRDAYAFVARGATRSTGELIGVTSVRVSKSSDTGLVTVTVAGPSGAISGDVDDPLTDLGAVNMQIQTSVVPDGVTAFIQSANPIVIPVTYEAWIYNTTSLSPAQIQTQITSKLTSFMSSQPIGGNVIPPDGGKVFKDAISTAIGATRPELFHVVVTAPAADVDVADILKPVLGAVTCTAIHIVEAV
jgi:phage-related baseplate assembly protein